MIPEPPLGYSPNTFLPCATSPHIWGWSRCLGEKTFVVGYHPTPGSRLGRVYEKLFFSCTKSENFFLGGTHPGVGVGLGPKKKLFFGGYPPPPMGGGGMGKNFFIFCFPCIPYLVAAREIPTVGCTHLELLLLGVRPVFTIRVVAIYLG